MDREVMLQLEGARQHCDFVSMVDFSIVCLRRKGYREESAEASAFVLVEADARGIFSHGAAGGTGLEESIRRTGVTATVDIEAVPEKLEQKYSTLGVIDAHGAPGHITSRLAVDWVKAMARENGMGKVWVSHANHFGAAGIWAEEIAKEKDLIGHVTCTTPASTRFMGHDNDGVDFTKGAALGKPLRLGTNPDAYSIPSKDGLFTIDMANTELAASLCLKLYKEGTATGKKKLLKIPYYVADDNYKPTLDPFEVLSYQDGRLKVRGTVFPYGGLRGYKGQIMLQRVEADHSFAGGPITHLDLGDTSVGRRISHAFEAQAIDFLYTADEALQRMSNLLDDWANYAGPATRMPGERSHLAREYSLTHGIPYSEGQIATLKRCGELAGASFDRVQSTTRPYPVHLFTK